MQKLIGYSFFQSQEEFEKWQLDNIDYSVHTVQPSATGIDINMKEKYKSDSKGDIAWGVFVTYSYEHSEAS